METKRNDAILITSSPRKNSNSTYMGKIFAESLFYNYEFIDINKCKINNCNGCNRCKNSFKCVFDDDAGKIIKMIENSEFIVLTAPIYFTGVPAKLKSFIDRNQVQWYKNKNRIKKDRKGIIILTADLKDKKNFMAAESEIKSFFAVNKIKTIAAIKLSSKEFNNKLKINFLLRKITKKLREKIG